MTVRGGALPDASVRRQRGVIASYVNMVVQIVVNLAYVPLLLSTIGQEEYGLYQFVGSIMAYLVSVNGVLSASVGRFYSIYTADGDTRMMENTLAIARRLFWGVSFVAVAIIAALIPAVRFVYSSSFTESQINECVAMLAVLAANMVVTFHNSISLAVATARECFTFPKVTQLVGLISQPLLILVLTQWYPHALTIALVAFATNAIWSAVQRLYVCHVLQARFTFHGWDCQLVKCILGFSSAVVLVSAADQLFWNSGKLIIGYYLGAGGVAVYGVGSQIYTAYQSAGLTVSGVFFQRVTELIHDNHDMKAVSSLFARVGRVAFVVCMLILGGFAVLGRDFVHLWAGPGYEDAFWIALILMGAMTIEVVQNMGITIMQVLDRYRFRGVVYFSLSVINIVACLVVAPATGIIGVVVATALCMIVGNGIVMNWYYAVKLGVDIGLFWREIFSVGAPLVATVASFIVLRAVVPCEYLGWLAFLLFGAMYVVAFVAVFWTVSSNEGERSYVARLFTHR